MWVKVMMMMVSVEARVLPPARPHGPQSVESEISLLKSEVKTGDACFLFSASIWIH